MAQAREGPTGAAADVVDDYDAICRVLQLYTEGEAKGDVTKLRQAFHADARMFGSIAPESARTCRSRNSSQRRRARLATPAATARASSRCSRLEMPRLA